ncbi:MAG: hypothetical protein H7Z72_10960 [Bacteroidetes bacterium]|nr:hypothetical protein [Fibrella sp.]
MKNPIARLLILLCCFATACHRPYALYQRTTPQTFHSPTPTPATSVADSTGWAALVSDSTQPATVPVAYASARPAVPTASRPSRVIESLTRTARPPAPAVEQVQPRPKPRARSEPQRKTLREVLGLKPRKKLNGWQRISWKLKAAVVVILIAVAFALLEITILAILFGLIGAFLLIKGLKKSFKVRRPLF